MIRTAHALVCAAFVGGCSTAVPVKATFPDAPQTLLERCHNLKTIDAPNPSIVDMLKVVVENYTLYWECSARVDGWQDWYKSQRDIFNK